MPFTTEFDCDLNKIVHYQRYPDLLPWVGEIYATQDLKLLILGESHYLRKKSTYHHDADTWYDGIDMSQRVDRSHIQTRGIIRNGINTKWKSKSKAIHRNIETALAQAGIKTSNGQTPLSTIAFYNYFQRPAEKSGQSILTTNLDGTQSAATFKAVLDILCPDLVLFCSRLAWRSAKQHGVDQSAVDNKTELRFTVHPSTSWWHRKMKKHQNQTGKQIFVNAVRSAAMTKQDPKDA